MCFHGIIKYLIVNLVFSLLGFWRENLFLTAPFPDLCLLIPSDINNYIITTINNYIITTISKEHHLGISSKCAKVVLSIMQTIKLIESSMVQWF